jgi:hypothetical protein
MTPIFNYLAALFWLPVLRVGIKKPTQKNPPKKTQKKTPKKNTKNGFFGFFGFFF